MTIWRPAPGQLIDERVQPDDIVIRETSHWISISRMRASGSCMEILYKVKDHAGLDR